MNPGAMLAGAILLPLLAVPLLIVLGEKRRNLREAVSLVTSVALFLLVIGIAHRYSAADGAALFRFHQPLFSLAPASIAPHMALSLSLEPLGLLFALLASGLWIVNAFYSVGYMRGARERNQTRFYCLFPLAISATIGAAFSDTLFTLFIFYEILTLSTWPLVAHKDDAAARQGARVYLGMLLFASLALLLPAILLVASASGTLQFREGGILAGVLSPAAMPLLLALFAFGAGKAALMPFHRWLPAAMVAPTPVSALLHAVAVVKTGVFALLKICLYTFGPEALRESGASQWLIVWASVTLLFASIVAMRKDEFKARLAWSTIGQLAYVTLGAALATREGLIGAAMQIPAHGVAKITLFFAAGAAYVGLGVKYVSELDGAGRLMPVTFAAFALGALSIIGLPPMGGVWPKFLLFQGAWQSQGGVFWQYFPVAALAVSSLLNVVYLLEIPFRAFFRSPRAGGRIPVRASVAQPNAAPLPCWLAPAITAFGAFVLFFLAAPILALIAPIAPTVP